MAGTMTVFRKEMADNFGSKRYLILFGLIVLLSTLSAYQGAEYLKNNPQAGFLAIFSGQQFGLSFVQLMVFFGPIIGLALGFDAINKERTSGTLSTILSQPIFRDSILNGKFLAGTVATTTLTVSTIAIMIGLAVPLLGFGPTLDGVYSIFSLALLTILYLAFWLSLGILFSVLTKKTSTSMLASIGTWLTSVIVISILAALIANVMVPLPSFQFNPSQGNRTQGGSFNPEQSSEYRALAQQRSAIQSSISKISPTNLYSQTASAILGIGQIEGVFGGYSGSTPFRRLTLAQGIEASWPNIVAIAVGLVICFVASYTKFLRSEIRPGG